MGVKVGAAALVLLAAIGVRAAGADTQKTTRDRVYTREQAARGGKLYVKHCERCHDPDKIPEGKKPGPPTVGPKFFEVWSDRTVGELFGSILNTMPSDGSAFLTPDQTVDLVARLMQLNGFPEGTTPLKNDEAMKAIVIVNVK